MKNLIWLAAVAVLFSSCGPKEENANFADLNVTQFDSALAVDRNSPLVDVRTPDEFAKGAIPGAINIDINDTKAFEASIQKLDKENTIYIYCLSGSRSAKALTKMQELGFKKVHNMAGGFIKWEAEGKPSTAPASVAQEATATATSQLQLADPESVTPKQYEQLIAEKKNVVFDFYAQWCGPCKLMSPVLEQLALKHKDKLVVYKIDVDKSKALSQQLKIDAIPYLLVYKDGKAAGKIVGFVDEAPLTQQVLQYFK